VSTQVEQTEPDSLLPDSLLLDDGEDATELCSWGLTSLASAAGRITVLWVAGEVDLFTLPVLRAALADGLDRRHGSLIVDLSQLTFCGLCGLTSLERAARIAAEQGVWYAVSGCPASLERIWSLLPNVDLPARYATVTDAVTAAWTDEAR